MGHVTNREQCPKCEDSGEDNLAVYEDGSKYCFGCSYFETAEGMKEEKTVAKKVHSELITNGKCSDIPTRGISRGVCQFFNYQVGTYTGGIGGEYCDNKVAHIANYCDSTGSPVAQKIRTAGKKMTAVGDGSKMSLYGQWLWEPSDKIFVTVVEGELDALSVAEAQGTRFPVVSVPHGAAGAKKALQKNLEWLSGFKHVVLCFDNDEAGQEAVKDCVPLFEVGKVKVAKLPLKDANEMILDGDFAGLKSALFNATSVKPESIVSIKDIMDEALSKPTLGLAWPWLGLTEVTYGLRPGNIYTIGAGSGIGKTEFLKDIMLNLAFVHNEKVGALFLEQKPAQTLLRLAGGMLGKRLHVPGDSWDEEEIREAMLKLEDKVYFYDHFGGQDIDTVLAKIQYMVRGLGCKYIILDHLTALAAGMQDERKGIDSAMAQIGALVQELDCSLFLVSHLAKPKEGKSYEEGKRVTSSSFRGSQSIQYWSSFMIGLERNKLAEDPEERLVTTVRILKDRFSGEADGCTISLTYNRTTGILEECEGFQAKNPFEETKMTGDVI